MNRKIKIAFYIAGILALGMFRESLFLNINAVLYNKYYPDAGAHGPSAAYAFLERLSYQALYGSKWIVTLLIVAAFWFLQRLLLSTLFAEKKPRKWLSMLYLSLFLLAAISYGTGWITGHLEPGYRFSRIFMGLLQSPVPAMILIPMAYFYKQNKDSL